MVSLTEPQGPLNHLTSWRYINFILILSYLKTQ